MISSPAFNIESNTFIGASKFKNFGLIVHNTDQMGGLAGKFNNFDSLEVATQTELNNDFLQISCNDYYDNNYDWSISPEFPTLGTLATQGTGCDPFTEVRAGNTFNVNTNGAESHIYSPLVEFKYYANGTPSVTIPALISPILANGNFEDVENCNNPLDDLVSCADDDPCPPPCDHLKLAYQKETNPQLKNQLFNKWITKNIMNDSLYNDSLVIAFIANSTQDNKNVLLLMHHFNNENYTQAAMHLNQIKGNTKYSAIFNLYTYLFTKINKGKLELNKKDKVTLSSLSNNKNMDGAIAQGYMKNNFGKTQKFIPETMGGKIPRFAFTESNSTLETTLNLKPQPASNLVVVMVKTTNDGKGTLNVCDLTGKKISYLVLENIHNEINFSLENYLNGVYVMTVQNNRGETIGIHKLVVAK
ncbi:MAG: T9SS type A sorting domain-containing protein [Bacteroidetes bacterium]|nr:T9SS type A sorting domain-containing protein [Bacteroidota bacterium]